MKISVTISIFILLINFSLVFAQNNAPEVTNVSFSQRDSSFIVDVNYDLNDIDGDTMFVTMQVSEDSGATWNFACDSISGDIGMDILSDTSKHIVWDFGSEHPETFGDAFRIAIIANDSGFEPGIVSDIDGNIYKTVKIGSQWWMAENLKVTHYRSSEAILHVTNNGQWMSITSGAYCNYNNDTTHVATYGRLYNWYAVDDSRNIAPQGWHVPNDAEWQALVDYLGGASNAGGKMKTTGTIQGGDGLWNSPNTGATNSSSFSALPGGYRSPFSGYCDFMGDYGDWWSTTESGSFAWARYLNCYDSQVGRAEYNNKFGISIRCVRD
jgi:uncharacterized protein (TIGR02145 family)